MTPAKFKTIRESLGLPTRWLAELFAVRESTVHRWEIGYSPIPPRVRDQITELSNQFADMVEAEIETVKIAHDSGAEAIIRVPEKDEHPVSPPEWPATTLRLVGLAAAEQSGARLEYAREAPDDDSTLEAKLSEFLPSSHVQQAARMIAKNTALISDHDFPFDIQIDRETIHLRVFVKNHVVTTIELR